MPLPKIEKGCGFGYDDADDYDEDDNHDKDHDFDDDENDFFFGESHSSKRNSESELIPHLSRGNKSSIRDE